MHIILMRHGEAVPFAPNDADRILTPKGKSQATNTGSQLKRGGWSPETVYCSTLIRAQQTAELVIDVMRLDVIANKVEGITPEDDWVDAITMRMSSMTLASSTAAFSACQRRAFRLGRTCT